MIGREFRFHNGGKGAALAVRVKSGSKIDQVLKDGTVVVNLTTSGTEINQKLLGFLAVELDIESNRIQIIAGEEGKNKLISVLEMEPEDIQRIILDRVS